jgi:hypothetical protein
MIARVQMSDLQRLVVLPVAMMLLLWAASPPPDSRARLALSGVRGARCSTRVRRSRASSWREPAPGLP